MKKMQKLCTTLLSAALVLTLAACGGGSSSASPSPLNPPVQTDPENSTGSRGTRLSITPDGELKITRMEKGTPSPAPQDGIWTVFVYMCGSDLESLKEQASKDILEMVAATEEADNLRFVVEAGGAHIWHMKVCADGENTRLIITGGQLYYLEGDTETRNMGTPQVLYNFLDWGLSEFRSQYVALDFWDHGGASIGGVCYDERFQDDNLSLMEIDVTLAELYRKHAVTFDLIGCDACLMSTVETANIFVPYGRYMIASQEVEPGSGWDYTGFAHGVRAGAADGAELGRYVCDAYFASITGDSRDVVTLSVIDLSLLDQFLPALDACCMDIYSFICGENGLDSVMGTARDLPSFGHGKFNSTDLGLLLQKTAFCSPNAERALALMKRCVVYMVNGSCYMDIGGISSYFPTDSLIGSRDLDILKNICVTPHYLGVVDVCAYGKETAGSISGYNTEQWTAGDSGFWSEDGTGQVDPSPDETPVDRLNFDPDYAQRLFSALPHRENPLIGFDKYAFTFSDEGLKNVDNVYTNLFQLVTIDGRERLIDLGAEHIASGNFYRSNHIRTEEKPFFGLQAGLPGWYIISPQPMYRRYVEGYGYVNFYCTPVLYNDVIKNLYFYEYYEAENSGNAILDTPRIIAVGTADTDTGRNAARLEPLKKGDTILPVFPSYYADTLEFDAYRCGAEEPYVCQEDGDFRMEWNVNVPNKSTYKWSYLITDIYGNKLYTPTVTCTVDRTDPDNLWGITMSD